MRFVNPVILIIFGLLLFSCEQKTDSNDSVIKSSDSLESKEIQQNKIKLEEVEKIVNKTKEGLFGHWKYEGILQPSETVDLLYGIRAVNTKPKKISISMLIGPCKVVNKDKDDYFQEVDCIQMVTIPNSDNEIGGVFSSSRTLHIFGKLSADPVEVHANFDVDIATNPYEKNISFPIDSMSIVTPTNKDYSVSLELEEGIGIKRYPDYLKVGMTFLCRYELNYMTECRLRPSYDFQKIKNIDTSNK